MKAIKEFIAEHLIHTEIFEMAQSIAEYKDEIRNILPTLIAHILLIMKSNNDGSIEYVAHWKKEVRGFIIDLCSTKLKSKDTYSSRRHHLEDVICRQYEIDTDDDYILKLHNKMYSEGYDLGDKETYDSFIVLWHKFQDEILQDLIDVLASKKINMILSFIDKL